MSPHLLMGLSASVGLPVWIGSDRGFSVGCLCSIVILEVGEVSLADELKGDFAKLRGGVTLSLPLRASNFCNNDLSYA